MNFTDQKLHFSNKNQIMIEVKNIQCVAVNMLTNLKNDNTLQHKHIFFVEN